MKLTIGVMGSSGGDLAEKVRRKAYQLGEAIAEHDAVLITGAWVSSNSPARWE